LIRLDLGNMEGGCYILEVRSGSHIDRKMVILN
jgi:hypothetical protein